MEKVISVLSAAKSSGNLRQNSNRKVKTRRRSGSYSKHNCSQLEEMQGEASASDGTGFSFRRFYLNDDRARRAIRSARP